ncbi:MAG TPA: YchJ family metal-binding protein [Ramlibacter sp.]|uniref:YchJ family protein n=1 Tax=Ramlibacter sp. TaxID=1917967 RepID=UPI002D7FD351|nr:YchJ family metal-binding protein [Ramlibacter sp.]HET8748588.1 YchJ family metal-binding protein [Ramlibacter sp.]
MHRSLPPSTACPCGRTGDRGRPLAFGACCGRWLGSEPAPDAEALMRSRYTAHVLGDGAYLLATWHPGTRPPDAEPAPATRWLGLEVRDFQVVDDAHAEVEFIARYRVQGRGGRLHERSRFVREDDGRWYYVDGEIF